MSKLDKYSYREQPVTPVGSKGYPARSARKPNLDNCPNGWDDDTWKLGLLFQHLAEKDEISLVEGMPLIYAKLERRIERSGIKEATEKQRTDEHGNVHSWSWLVEQMIEEFWTRYWDEHAVDYFTDFNIFREMGRTVRDRHWARRTFGREETR